MKLTERPSIEPRHDRIFALREIRSYPGSPWLDMTFWLPPSDDDRRRIWVLAPTGSPTIRVDDAELVPGPARDGTPRWIDYGVAKIPLGFTQLRIAGLQTHEAAQSYLVVSRRLDLTFADETVEDAERKLWGMSRSEAGTTTITPDRVTVGAPAEFVVCYRAGAKGLPAGALVRFTVPMLFDAPQSDDSTAPGFTAIRRSDRRAALHAIERSVESHEKVDILCRIEKPLSAGEALELSYSTAKTYIFPSTFAESDARYWYSHRPPMGAAVALSGRMPLVGLESGHSHSVTFVPGPPERLHLFLPGRRRCSEELSLTGVFTDRYRNVPASGALDSDLEITLAGEGRTMPLGTPREHFTSAHTFSIPMPHLPPAVYRAAARRKGSAEVLAQSNPMELIEEKDGQDKVFWGEIHAHTEMSDGSGSYGELLRHARDVGCLDFAAAADHACYFSDNEWQWMQDVTNAWNQDGRFVTLIGYEWAGRQIHRCIYTSRDRLKLFRGMYEPQSNLSVVWREFRGDAQVVGGPHGGLAHGLDWTQHDPEAERFVEVYSVWGANDLRENALVPDFARNNPGGLTANELLLKGAKLGFTGGGDCHEGHAGFSSEDACGQGTTSHTFAKPHFYRSSLTAVLSPSLSRRSIIQAIRNRRTYATTGARILLNFEVSGIPMGGEGPAGKAKCRSTVHAEAPLEAIEIIRDGMVAMRKDCGAMDIELDWEDVSQPAGNHYYYLHVLQRDGQQAWSSPVGIVQGPKSL